MNNQKTESNRHTIKNRVRGLRAVRSMRAEAQVGFDRLWTLDAKVYCYPEDPSGNTDVQLEPGYGRIKLRDDDRFEVTLNDIIVKNDLRYHELEEFLSDHAPKKNRRKE